MMTVIKNSDGSGLCHTLVANIRGKIHSVADYSDYLECEHVAQNINNSGYVILATEFNPMLYTAGIINNERFEPEQDFSNFNEAFDWCLNN